MLRGEVLAEEIIYEKFSIILASEKLNILQVVSFKICSEITC